MTLALASVISVEASNEIKEAIGALVAINQMQADSLISIQRKADVSKLKAERALADKDGKKTGVRTQMEVLEDGGPVWSGWMRWAGRSVCER